MGSRKDKPIEQSNPFIAAIALWQNAFKSWMDAYNEYIAVYSKMTEHWLNLYSGSLFKERKKNNNNN
jgi:hypothetical protein